MEIIAPKLPEPGRHAATVVEVEDSGVNPFDPAKERHRLKLVFKLKDGGTQCAWANATLGYRSTLRPIVVALLGSVPAVFQTDAIIGRSCEIEVQHYTDKKGQQRSRVTEVHPLTKLSA